VDIGALYDLWLSKALEDKDLTDELIKIKGDDAAIYERFYRELEFGTGGLRGIIGAGSYRLNIYTIRKATQGLACYLKEMTTNPSVAIAYDSRIKSDLFAKSAAEVFAGNGIKVYMYSELMPTPMLSFAVRALKTDAGIVVTASHNPAKYNGYKVYGSDGCQMTIDAANKVLENIEKVDTFDGVQRLSFEQGISEGLINYINDSVINEYYENVLNQSVNKSLLSEIPLKIIYTPLNGAGNKPVRAVLDKIGIRDITIVKEQELPDGNFPTIPFPNPEIRQVFEIAIGMAKQIKPDILLATDPDCDRVGIAVRQKDEFILMSGNEVGVLLLDYLLAQRSKNGTMPKNPMAVKTIVTTPLASLVAQKYGCEIIDVLTGFKFIGEQIGLLEQKGEANRYIFGFEESYGYLAGSYVRDKDAVVGSMLICEMAAFYKKQGKTLIDVMSEIYEEHGYYLNTQESFEFEGSSGMEKMNKMMTLLRETAPVQIGSIKVLAIADYLTSSMYDLKTEESSPITLPKSDVLCYFLSDGANVIIRPSGTEPKIKAYISTKGYNLDEAQILADSIKKDIPKLLGI